MPKPSRRAALTARSADRHALYEAAVQDPDRDVRLLERIHARVAKRPLRVFREDFCGTAALSATFVRRGEGRRAIGVDLDASTLAWGRRAHLAPLPPETRARVSLVRADVRAPSRVRADLTAAFNFSWQVFRAREDLHAYFRSALRGLAPGGVLVCDAWGGSEAVLERSDRRRVQGFTYVWERRSFDPVTHDLDARIHFEFRDGTAIRDAFVYRWRLWTLPDLREALEAVGFEDVHVLWEGTDPRTGSGNGAWRRVERGEACRSFVAYVVARRPAARRPSGRRRRSP